MSNVHQAAGCPVCGRLSRLLATTLAWSLAFIAAWFLVRRLAGGFGAAPSGLALLATAIVLAGCSVLVRQLGRLEGAFTQSNLGRAVWLAPSAAGLALGLAIATFAESGLGVAVFWIVFLLTEAEAYLGEGRMVLAPWLTLPAQTHVAMQPPAMAQAPLAAAPAIATSISEAPGELAEGVTLQLTRQQTAQGELVHGAARAIFEVGRKIASVHVSFGEPLAGVPEVVAELRSDIEVEIECVQALAHGARFDLRLRRPAIERTEVLFDFEAYTGSAESEAA